MLWKLLIVIENSEKVMMKNGRNEKLYYRKYSDISPRLYYNKNTVLCALVNWVANKCACNVCDMWALKAMFICRFNISYFPLSVLCVYVVYVV